jgi:hypothetical protein
LGDSGTREGWQAAAERGTTHVHAAHTLIAKEDKRGWVDILLDTLPDD